MKFEKELETLVAKKDVEEIMQHFPTKTRLITAIALNEDLPFSEEVVTKIVNHFQPEATIQKITTVMITSNQADIVIARTFNPSFRLKFIGHGPVEATEEVAEYLLKTGNFKKYIKGE